LGQGAPPGFLIEFYVDLESELFLPGTVEVVETAGNTVAGNAPIVYGPGPELLITVPLTTLLIDEDANISIAAIVGTVGGEATDQVPNPVASAVIPEPSSSTIFGIGLAFLALARRQRRR
jgi:hypothetical protein